MSKPQALSRSKAARAASTAPRVLTAQSTKPDNGTISRNGDLVTFTPRADYTGNAGFRYVVQDAHGANRKGWMFSTGAGEIVERGSVFGREFRVLHGGMRASRSTTI